MTVGETVRKSQQMMEITQIGTTSYGDKERESLVGESPTVPLPETGHPMA